MRVFGIIGWKNAGKTSLMERLVAEITARGHAVSTVKHVHHEVDLDQPGKDSYRHRAAGAREVVLASAQRFAVLVEHRGPEPALKAVLARLAPVDLVLVEGYKRDAHPKIEVYRTEAGHDLIQPGDPSVRAVATDGDLVGLSVPVLDLNDTKAVADFVLEQVGLHRPSRERRRATAHFDTVAIVDWSATSVPSPAPPSRDAIWIGICRADGEQTSYHRTRAEGESVLRALIAREGAAGRRLLVGFDFAMGYPAGFAERLTANSDPRAVWEWLEQELSDTSKNENNRLIVAAKINAQLGGSGPFWVVNAKLAGPSLPFGKTGKIDYEALGLAQHRAVELSGTAGQPKSVWQLSGPGAVGSQSLMGLPTIHRLSKLPDVAVWPFQPWHVAPVVLAEVYPAIIGGAVAAAIAEMPEPKKEIADKWQVTLLARALWRLAQNGQIEPLFEVPEIAREEGWILGAGHQKSLRDALR